MDFSYWFTFLSAAVLLTLSPGPDLLYVLSRTVSHGRRIGIASSLGVCSGAFFHVVAAALGVSAILATSAIAFSIVKYLGAAYLIYLGYKAFRSAGDSFQASSSDTHHVSFWSAFKQGILIDILNPKVAVFFMAFLPQFVRLGEGNIALQMTILGFIVIMVGVVLEFIVILLAERATTLLRANNVVAIWLDRALGTILVGLGIRLALTEKV